MAFFRRINAHSAYDARLVRVHTSVFYAIKIAERLVWCPLIISSLPLAVCNPASSRGSFTGRASLRDVPQSSSTSLSLPRGGGSGLPSRALGIFMGEVGGNRSRWLTSTRELRLVSRQICNDCRRDMSFRVWVGNNTPRSLWAVSGNESNYYAGNKSDTLRDGAVFKATQPRLLAVCASAVVWDRCAEDLRSPAVMDSLRHVKHLRFGFHFNQPLEGVMASLPQSLVSLDLGVKFQQRVSGIRWPSSLRELKFGASFNSPIGGVKTWPPCLIRLIFGANFNQPIDGVTWPASLRFLEFGRNFDQDVSTGPEFWPPKLESLTFGTEFSRELGGHRLAATLLGEERAKVAFADLWPSSLRQLTLSQGFRQPIDTVAWPDKLEELNLDCVTVRGWMASRGWCVGWPRRLRRLTLDFDFHQSVAEVPLPKTLRELTFGDTFNQSIVGVRWPRGLKRLRFGASFNRPMHEVRLPPTLEFLAFGHRFNKPLKGVRWPQGVKEVVFQDHFDQPIGAIIVRWPKSLEALSFGWAFNQPLDDVAWPAQLSKLALGSRFHQPHSKIRLPPGLSQLELGGGCKQNLDGLTWPDSLFVIIVGRGDAPSRKGSVKGLPRGCRVLER